MQCWHFDDKCKKIINDGVKELVCHLPPWKMCHRLQLVIYKQLRAHHDKTCNNKLIIEKNIIQIPAPYNKNSQFRKNTE
jgi:hypothetical protein